MAQGELDSVIFVPCRESPLKGRIPGAPAQDRINMLRLATAGYPWASVTDWELNRPGPSYSWQTAGHFASIYPDASLYWLMGEDQWASLEKWARPDFLREHLIFIVFGRNGMAPVPRTGWRHLFLPGEFPGSSTEARRMLASGETSKGGLLPPEVEAYAVTHRLYRPSDP